MSKQKFDLTNVGGQPKDWMQREHEKSLEPGLGLKAWGLIALLIFSLLLVGLGLFQLIAWILR